MITTNTYICMIKLYLKQAWALLRQNPLFSGLYIAGTGLAIAISPTRRANGNTLCLTRPCKTGPCTSKTRK